ncbi:hypothetical protein JXB41_07100 [Candidatus Woesearchaeota archaeon]|nr:hypothetical protein [Candidatus Woesearchaeota archaeon]
MRFDKYILKNKLYVVLIFLLFLSITLTFGIYTLTYGESLNNSIFSNFNKSLFPEFLIGLIGFIGAYILFLYEYNSIKEDKEIQKISKIKGLLSELSYNAQVSNEFKEALLRVFQINNSPKDIIDNIYQIFITHHTGNNLITVKNEQKNYDSVRKNKTYLDMKIFRENQAHFQFYKEFLPINDRLRVFPRLMKSLKLKIDKDQTLGTYVFYYQYYNISLKKIIMEIEQIYNPKLLRKIMRKEEFNKLHVLIYRLIKIIDIINIYVKQTGLDEYYDQVINNEKKTNYYGYFTYYYKFFGIFHHILELDGYIWGLCINLLKYSEASEHIKPNLKSYIKTNLNPLHRHLLWYKANKEFMNTNGYLREDLKEYLN